MNQPNNITFELDETVDGLTTWWIDLNGETVGQFDRSRYYIYSCHKGDYCPDRDTPMTYSTDFSSWGCDALNGLAVRIPDATDLRIAKKLIAAAITNHLTGAN